MSIFTYVANSKSSTIKNWISNLLNKNVTETMSGPHPMTNLSPMGDRTVTSEEYARIKGLLEEEPPSRLPMFGPLEVTDVTEFIKTSRIAFTAFYNRPCRYKADVENFLLLKTIGSGSFGVVYLAKKKDNNKLYAMKSIEKAHIVKLQQIPHVLNEKKTLQCIDFPFGVRMEFFCKDNAYIYFVLPFIPGGEIFTHLRRQGRFPEPLVVFYAAQVVLGLEYLHELGLVYRDLKPENLLLDHLGYLKITDFGFTKLVISRTYTFCGTPHYLAPEIILGYGYSRSVDWWALGVLIHELSCGYPPFEATDNITLFRMIIQCRYETPYKRSEALKSLLHGLLELDVTKRLGNLRSGAKDIKDHEWFKDINWLALFNRQPRAPLIPPVADVGDISNFPGATIPALLKSSSTDQFAELFSEF